MGWLEDAVRSPLAELGFRKRANGIFTMDLESDVLGWLGLNRASEHQAPGRFEVNPVVGIRLQRVERDVARLTSQPFHQYIPPSVSSPLGYLMPGARYHAWELEAPDGPPAAARSMADAVRDYGLSFIRTNSTPEAVAQLLDRRRLEQPEVFRIAVILAFSRRLEDATALVTAAVERLGPRADAAAANLRNFAKAFETAPPE